MAKKPAARSRTSAGVRTLPNWSQAKVGKYIPNHIASRIITLGETGGRVEKRWFKNATIGRAVPVIANTPRKKNSHLGPTVG